MESDLNILDLPIDTLCEIISHFKSPQDLIHFSLLSKKALSTYQKNLEIFWLALFIAFYGYPCFELGKSNLQIFRETWEKFSMKLTHTYTEDNFNDPWGICLHPKRKNELIIAGSVSSIFIFDRNSEKCIKTITGSNYSTPLSYPSEICYIPFFDCFLVTDCNNNRILKLSLDYEILGNWGLKIDTPINMIFNHFRNEVLIFSGDTLQVHTIDGEFIKSINIDVTNMDIDEKQKILYVFSKNDSKLYKINLEDSSYPIISTTLSPTSKFSLVKFDKRKKLIGFHSSENRLCYLEEKNDLLVIKEKGPVIEQVNNNHLEAIFMFFLENEVFIVFERDNNVRSWK